MKKRGYTVINFVLILGILVIGAIVIANLKGLSYKQAEAIEEEIAAEFLKNIANAIEGAMLYPSDSVNSVKLGAVREYELNIMNNKINLFFPSTRINLSYTLPVSNLNIIPTSIKSQGNLTIISKGRNLFVSDKIKCFLNDDVCDPGCIYYDELIEKECYQEIAEGVCISYYIDINKDGLTNHLDSDNICDPDCYNEQRNGGFYDFDCLESGDNICDPDTHMVRDFYCDTDCFGANGVCDLDCAVYDVDCPHLDNGICEIMRFENCMTTYDCNCEQISKTCNPADNNADAWGCV
ncbi:hypothetical protein JW930_02740 [Candidatus Woesearchaeota archaeon]|nr:hypothetical protein [Candidatus Woesearchaeota archaeon]